MRNSRHGELLHLVVGVAGLEARAEGVALDRLRQDHGRRALVLDGGPVGGVHLARLVAGRARSGTAPASLASVSRAPSARSDGFGAEEVLAHVGGVAGGVRLELRVGGLAAGGGSRAPSVSSAKHLVPGRAPQRLDHVPAGGAELGLQLLHDLEVGADRAVEALQVAVDDEGQVVQALAAGQRQGGGRLGLVHLAVAEERPDVGVRRCP